LNELKDIQDELDKLKKDSIDKLLEIIYHQSLTKRVSAFQPPFTSIVSILEQIGKDILSVIVKYKSFFNFKRNIFSFYFWPGYTTLDGRRVFIEGTETGRINQRNFFTGIGGQFNFERNTYTKFNDSIYFKDCPSTLSFDKVLNSRYFNEEYNPKYSGKEFYAGSTHFFRLNQTRHNIDGNWGYIPLKLGNFHFKTLHVTTENKLKISENKSTLSVFLNSKELSKSGLIIKEELQKFLNTQAQKSEWSWPFNSIPFINIKSIPEIKEIERSVIDLQIQLYSYWINETLGNGTFYKKKEFKLILEELSAIRGYQPLLSDLGFFNKIDKYKSEIITKKSDFVEIYFKHWYTIFHENFCTTEDLGSTMLLTNQILPSSFLIAIDRWIKDIYDDLKLIESKTRSEIESQRKNISILKHSQIQFINAQKYFIDELKSIEESSKSILQTQIDFISGYLDIAEQIDKNIENINIVSSEVNLIDIVKHCLTSILTILKYPDHQVIKKNIKGVVNPTDYCNKITPLIEKLIKSFSDKTLFIRCDEIKLSLLIKELIINCLENINQNSPIFNIEISNSQELTIKFSNNLDRVFNESQYKCIREGSFLEGKFGWRIIFALIKYHRWHFEVCDWDNIANHKTFIFTIKIS